MDKENWINREAKLLEAGDYPDKGVVIDQNDLQRLADAFDEPAPIYVEHAPSPFKLGWLDRVWRKGAELFGSLRLMQEANDLLDRLGIASLSVGLASDLSSIVEVSITGNPRIADARLFNLRRFSAQLLEVKKLNNPDWQQKAAELETKLRQVEAERQVQAWLTEGRVTPGAIPFALRILQTEPTLRFSDGEQSIAETFVQFVNALPKRPLFGELAPAQTAQSLDPEAAQFLQEHFPDIELNELTEKGGLTCRH
ncbi:MAG: hypothetical protein HUU60_10515 [Armatimonadetes bacterium]|nr:hypothetical protein [Armatimonadota bacterium]